MCLAKRRLDFSVQMQATIVRGLPADYLDILNDQVTSSGHLYYPDADGVPRGQYQDS